MAVPKQRHNSSRTRRRRKHNEKKKTIATTIACADCSAQHLPHRVCDECGKYRGVQYKEVVQKVN